MLRHVIYAYGNCIIAIENVQKWTFSVAISISPNSTIALKNSCR